MRASLVCACVGLCLSMAVGCGHKTGNNANEIVVGEYGSLTGPEKQFGVSTDNGIKLAVDQQNAGGGIRGKKIVLKTDDDASNADQATSDVLRLIQEDHAVAILGEVASSRSLRGKKIAQQLGVPMISPSSTNPMVTQGATMVSRVCFVDSFQGYVGAKFAHDDLHLTSGAVLYDNSEDYSKGLKSDFVKAFEQMGGKIVAVQSYGKGANEFASQLTALRDSHPQFVYLPGYYSVLGSIIPQARKLGLDVPFIGGDGWVDDKTIKDTGAPLDGCYFTDHYDRLDARPEVKDFLTAYRAAYHSEPDSMAALGYDAAKLLFAAMEKSPTLDGKDLSAAINATTDFHGVTGLITIDADRNARKAAVIQKIENGAYTAVAHVEPPK
jgi:branched-chain amino acid transport system substrate-binding protein